MLGLGGSRAELLEPFLQSGQIQERDNLVRREPR